MVDSDSDETHDDAGATGPATSMHVRRARRGDAQSLEWLVTRLSPLLLAQARYRLGPALADTHDAADVVHDAWLATLPRLADLDERAGRFTPVLLKFLSTAVLHNVRNLLRARARREFRLPTEVEPAASRRGPLSEVLRGERDDALRQALRGLDEQDREILILRGVEQVSANTAAALLSIGEAAVAKRYQRALVRLRRGLPREIFDELSAATRE